MRRIFTNWITGLPLLALSLGACHKMHASDHDLELLTHTPWKYERAGFDSNQDGVFDALDPRIAGCDRDDEIIFKPDGTGSLEQGLIKCKVSDPASLPFVWSFQDNDSAVYFQDQLYRVRTLTSERFEIYADQQLGVVSTRYIIIFKH